MAVASDNSSANPPVEDRSQLNLPISTGVTGIHQVMRCIQGGTPEVRDLLLNECDLVYECRVCRSLFRSLANFLYHKREFCHKHICENLVLFTAEDTQQDVITVQPESPKEPVVENGDIVTEGEFFDHDDGIPTADLQDSIDLPKLGICTSRIFQAVEKTDKCKHTDDVTETWHTKDCNAKSSSAVAFYTKCANNLTLRSSANIKKSVVSLKPIDSNPNAVFQSMKTIPQTSSAGNMPEVEEEEPMTIAEVREKVEALKTAVVHVENTGFHPKQRQRYYSDNTKSVIARLKERTDCNVNTLNCFLCKTQYMSVKTLDFHMRTIHSDKRLYYPCPFCKTLFVQLWGVTRHMASVHKKTKEQINKLREVVRKRAFRKTTTQVAAKGIKKIVSTPTKGGKSPKNKVAVTVRHQKDSKESKAKAEEYICKTCKRSFDRKSSLSNHQKYCLNEGKPKPPPERNINTSSSVSPTKSVPSFKSPTSAKSVPIGHSPKRSEGKALSNDANGRPKRSVKKREQEDFVDSSAIGYSRITHKSDSPVRKPNLSVLEQKILGIISMRHLQCLKCKRRFSTYSNLRRHAAIHVGWNRFKCKYCDYQAYNRSDCRNHIQRIHLLGKSSQVTIDKLVIDLPQNVQVKRENVDLTVNAKKADIAQLATHSSMQPSLSIKLTKTLPNTSLSLTPTKVTDSKSKVISLASAKVSLKQAKTNPVLNESVATSLSPVPGSSSSVSYSVSTRHTPRSPVSSPKRTSDDISTLVTRSGMYRKTYLVSPQSESKASKTKKRDTQENENVTDDVPKDYEERLSPDLLFSTPESGTSESDAAVPMPIAELLTCSSHVEETDTNSTPVDHSPLLIFAEEIE